MSTPEVVREALSTEAYNPLAKQKAAAKLSRIPIKVEQGEVLKIPVLIRVKAGSPTTRFCRSAPKTAKAPPRQNPTSPVWSISLRCASR